ncbi:MAG: LamB/YcsF family protein [Gemmataceae bacterium]|nr:LamB/YcsF family protein [Gemmataceae bacterium]
MEIDLNCDLGEGCEHDAEIMRLVTSANIACGFHAGDVFCASEALRVAHELGVVVGAHPGYPDREHFGRRERDVAPAAVIHMIVRQVNVLRNLAKPLGVPIRYLKPHGALYHQACRDDDIGRAVCLAAAFLGLPVVGLPRSCLETQARGRVPFVAEGFVDRRYRADGTLVPRSEPDALLTDPEEAARQAQALARDRGVRTLCVHGDHPDAVVFIRAVRAELLKDGVVLRPFV